MTDAKFKNLMQRTFKAKNKYYLLLHEIEEEYYNRFGIHPGAADDDFWIDTFHDPGGDLPPLEELEEAARQNKLINQ